jgi:hypothetical protein
MPGTERKQCDSAEGIKSVRNLKNKKQHYFIFGLIKPLKEWECVPCNSSHKATNKKCVSHFRMTILEAIIYNGAN